MEYSFIDVLQVSSMVRAYLTCRDEEPKPTLTKVMMELAIALIRPTYSRGKWHLAEPKKLADRLLSAGIDPISWQIVDNRAAGFAWMQLRTTRVYSMRRQKELIASNNVAPDIDIVLKFATKAEMHKAGINTSFTPAPNITPVAKEFGNKMRDHFN
jgi:hypothetical protein